MSDVESTFAKFVETVTGEIGPPFVSNQTYSKQFKSDHGDYRRLAAVWMIDGQTHGVDISHYLAGRYRLRVWGNLEEVYDVEIWMRRDPMISDLEFAAKLVCLQ